MDQNINLLISGKTQAMQPGDFLAALGLQVKPEQENLLFEAALQLLSNNGQAALLMGATCEGQAILLDNHSELLYQRTEKKILAYTAEQGKEAFAFTLADEAGLEWYSYYKSGKLLRSVTLVEGEADEKGPATSFEAAGLSARSVLKAYCCSWEHLQGLRWNVYRLVHGAK